MKNKPGILFVINDFNVGGAELFVFRLGIALQTNYSICILDLYPTNCDVEFRQQFIESGFVLLNRYHELSNFKEKLFWKINAFFSIIGIKGVYSKLKKKEQTLYQEKQPKNFTYKVKSLHEAAKIILEIA